MSLIYKQNKDKSYITLKEASTLSGYSSDYIGQLIRSGKISGKRVYANPVWMTTEKDLMDYLEANRPNGNSDKNSERKLSNILRFWKTKVLSELEILKLYRGILYFAITVSLVFSLFVFYIFSVSFDAWLSDRSFEKREEVSTIPEEIIEVEGVSTF